MTVIQLIKKVFKIKGYDFEGSRYSKNNTKSLDYNMMIKEAQFMDGDNLIMIPKLFGGNCTSSNQDCQ